MKKFLLKEPVEVVTPKGHRFNILPHFCKGCRICVEFCPTGTLGLLHPVSWSPDHRITTA